LRSSFFPLDLKDDPAVGIRTLDVMNAPHPVLAVLLRNPALLGRDKRQDTLEGPQTREPPFGETDVAVLDGKKIPFLKRRR
jgi:hypothetical protein